MCNYLRVFVAVFGNALTCAMVRDHLRFGTPSSRSRFPWFRATLRRSSMRRAWTIREGCMLSVLSSSNWKPPGTAASTLRRTQSSFPQCIRQTAIVRHRLTTIARVFWWDLEKNHLSLTPNDNCDRESLALSSVVHFIYHHQFVLSCDAVRIIGYDILCICGITARPTRCVKRPQHLDPDSASSPLPRL